jgi:hypothetical protein
MARKVMGPSGSRRRRWLLLYAGLAAIGTAAFFISAAGALINSPSNFEAGDGNMTQDTGTSSLKATDWNCFQGANGFVTLTSGTPANCAATTGANQITADGANNAPLTGEVEQTPGQKFDTVCPTFKGGNNPPKDEWSNIAEYIEPALNGDVYFYGASIRPVVNGNSSGNIYFSQSSGCRTTGDILLTFDFLNGGGTAPVLHALSWQATGGSCYVKSDSPPCWGPSSAPALTGDNSTGFSNGSIIQAADNAINGQQLPVNAFAEIGVNLTQAIKAAGGSATCFARETWVSRSSGSSFTSSPEDVEIDNKPTCGTITIVKHTLNGAGSRPSPGINQDFSYTDNIASTNDTFTLNDSAGCDPSTTCTNASNTQSFTLVQPGSYTVDEPNADMPANFAFVSLSCTPTGNGTSAGPDTTTPTQADITLGVSGSVVCTYVNQQQLGAILITKSGKDKNCASSLTSISNGKCTGAAAANLGGATFSVTSGGTAISGSPFTTSNSTGTVCIGGLSFGDYVVTETGAPTGFKLDSSTPVTVTVSHNASCNSTNDAIASGTGATQTFTDTPKTDVTVEAKAQLSGATQSTVTCGTGVDSTGAITGTIGNSPQGPASDAKVTDTGESPGTYYCKIFIDP